mgnify:CR=1 FL=1|jgi:ABC-2 type transport system ATP-binding protein
MSIIELKQVLKKYDGKTVVDHLTLHIDRGEIFGLVGPNGAGKSTTIKMISTLIPQDDGVIRVGQLDVKKDPLGVKKKIGVVPQEIAIFESLTAYENVAFFGKLYGLKGSELKRRVDEALEFAGLLDRKHAKPKTFSGGMKRRLNIACSIIHQPEVIIMDEPTVGIDPQSRNHILESVKKLNKQGTTVIYTSHYMEEVSAICNRIGIMDHGRLIAVGTQEELRERMVGQQKVIIRASPITPALIDDLRKHPKVKQVTTGELTIELLISSSQFYLQDILFILSEHQAYIHSMTVEEPDLEKLFLSLTGKSLRD